MLTVLLLQVVALITAQLESEWKMVNKNSVFAGTMSNDLIEELAEAAFSLWKADNNMTGKKKKKPVHSFMDYDDAVNKLDDMAVDSPAALVVLNAPQHSPPSSITHKPSMFKKLLKKKLLPSHKHHFIPKISHRKKFRLPAPSRDAYVLPPEGFSQRKGPRWATISQGRYRIHGKGRVIREPIFLPHGGYL